MSTRIFQPMPELAPDQLDALRAEIAAHGVLVPITVDQYGRVIDGHNRSAIAAELGIECPQVVVTVEDDDTAMDLAVTLNGARRHLNQEQKRTLIRNELVRRPKDSDRAIARRVGCSPTTVGTVRADARAEAEEATRKAWDAFNLATTSLRGACLDLIYIGAHPDDVRARLAEGRDGAHERAGRLDRERQEAGLPIQEGSDVVREIMQHAMFAATYNDIGDVVADAEAEGVEFPLPLTGDPQEIEALLARIPTAFIKRPTVQSGQREEVAAR